MLGGTSVHLLVHVIVGFFVNTVGQLLGNPIQKLLHFFKSGEMGSTRVAG